MILTSQWKEEYFSNIGSRVTVVTVAIICTGRKSGSVFGKDVRGNIGHLEGGSSSQVGPLHQRSDTNRAEGMAPRLAMSAGFCCDGTYLH